MKFITLFLATLLFAPNVFAKTNSEALEEIVDQLGELSRGGASVYQLKGVTPEELVYSLVDEIDGYFLDDEKPVMNKTDVYSADEMAYGTTDQSTVYSLIVGAMDFMDEGQDDVSYTPEIRAKVSKALSTLSELSVIYSWNPNGDSVCGMTFTNPVLIDPETKKAYEINFYSFEGC